MRRANDLGEEMRRSLGGPGPGAADEEFLAALSSGRGRQTRNRRILSASVGLVALLAIVLSVVVSADRRTPELPEPPPLAKRGAPLVDVPEAALLLAAARLRLEGFGDPAVAPGKLEEVVRRYPGSRSAARAAALLRALEGSR